METLKQQINQYYRLESARIQQSHALRETEEKLRTALWELRQKQQEQVLYEGTAKYLLHRITGRAEEEKERLLLAVRSAQTEQSRLLRLRDSLKQDIRELTAELEALPTWDSLLQKADAEARDLWAQREGRLCAQMLVPMLEKVDTALEAYRAQLRGERMGEMASAEEVHETGTAHIALARECAPLLSRMQGALRMQEKPFSPGGYFENPGGFIDSAAARHNRIDRVSMALGQVAALRRELRQYLQETE